jgi:hypothetical protein
MSETTSSSNRGRLVLDLLLALDLGLVVAGLNVFLLRQVGRGAGEKLLWPKSVVSEWIGNLKGWTPHLKEADPIGFWIQLAGVTLLSGIALFGVVRLLSRKASADLGVGLFPGIVSVTVPWVCLGLSVDVRVEPREAMHFLVLASPVIALALSIRACVLVHRNEWRARRAEIISGLVVGCGLVLLLAEAVGVYARPLLYASLLIGACLFALWAFRTVEGRRRGVSRPGEAIA